MDTKILRQKILDLAIRGKLVKQDANEEPANVLLARIRKEKERLVKEGKLKKKDLVTTPVSDEDKPFEVPEGWEWVTVKDICSKFTTGPFGSMVHKTDYVTNGGVPLVNPANMIDGEICMNKIMYVSIDKSEELQKYKLEFSDVLLARRGDLTKCVIIREQQAGWLCGTGAFVLHAILLDPQYFSLIYSSTYIQSTLKKESVGATMDNLNQGLLGSLPIPLPPLSEQQRIVAEVENWMSLIDTIENGKENLLQSIATAKSKILDLAVNGKLVEKEGDWEEKTLGEIFQHNTGKALNKSARQEGQLLPYITTSNLYWDHFELDNVKSMYFKDSEIEKCTVTKGDLLVCEGGDIGRSAIWNLDYDICIQNHIHRLRPIIDALPKFYYYVLMFYKSTNNIQGKGIGMLGLSSKQLDKIILPLPPLSEQQRIVTKIEQIFAQLDSIAAAIKS